MAHANWTLRHQMNASSSFENGLSVGLFVWNATTSAGGRQKKNERKVQLHFALRGFPSFFTHGKVSNVHSFSL